MRTDWQLDIPWNLHLFERIHGRRHALADIWYASYYHLGKGYAVLLFVPLFYWLAGPVATIHLLVATLSAGLAARALKLSFQHKRPSKLLAGVQHSERIYSRSFPSGDSAFAFAVVGAAVLQLPSMALPWLVLYALLIAYGRIYQGVHFPLDVLVGALVGLLMAWWSYDFSVYLGWLSGLG